MVDQARRVLITNDDGIDAPGLAALRRGAAALGEVWVVAPQLEASATSHAVSLARPLWTQEVGERQFTVSGTPTDCVFIALGQLMPAPPDLLISGINRGGNLAVDVTYSGTVGAAMEGTIRGVPSMAVSRNSYEAGDYGPAVEVATHIGSLLLNHGLPRGVYLNVNVPARPADSIRGVVAVPLGHRAYSGDIERRHSPHGVPYSWIAGKLSEDGAPPGTDVAEVRDDYVTVTPLTVDWTERQALQRLSGWELSPW